MEGEVAIGRTPGRSNKIRLACVEVRSIKTPKRNVVPFSSRVRPRAGAGCQQFSFPPRASARMFRKRGAKRGAKRILDFFRSRYSVWSCKKKSFYGHAVFTLPILLDGIHHRRAKIVKCVKQCRYHIFRAVKENIQYTILPGALSPGEKFTGLPFVYESMTSPHTIYSVFHRLSDRLRTDLAGMIIFLK